MDAKLDGFGRIVIPKKLRDRLGLEPGDPIEVEARKGEVVLRPVRAASPLARRGKAVVFEGEAMGPLEDAVKRERRKRIGRLSTGEGEA